MPPEGPTREKREAARQAKLAEANLNHLSWLASYTKTPMEQTEAKSGRRIDPVSPEGRNIIVELSARYPDLSLATASSSFEIA